MDTLQAAILLAKFELFPDEVAARVRIGEQYTKLLNDAQQSTAGETITKIEPPYIESYNASVFAQYTVKVGNRSALQDALKQNNIPTAVHYPVPLHRQPALKLVTNNLSISEKMSEKVMSLPMHPYLVLEDQKMVVDKLLKLY
jgi:UDP-2-acetamido-2-deoxy-ribo-hexuluronate aminotransferase